MNIYADHAATNKDEQAGHRGYASLYGQVYGNPSSLHSYGQRGAEALQNAREQMAKGLGCSPREITFVSGGSEADNQAILSAARIGERRGKSILYPPPSSIMRYSTRWML